MQCELLTVKFDKMNQKTMYVGRKQPAMGDSLKSRFFPRRYHYYMTVVLKCYLFSYVAGMKM